MDAVIQAEASTLQCGTCYSYVDVVVTGGPTTLVSAWVTVFIDQLRLIKRSLWANAPNEDIPHKTKHKLSRTKAGVYSHTPAFILSRSK